MKRVVLLSGTFLAGYMFNTLYPTMIKSVENKKEEHSFTEFIKQKDFSQPKIIDELHKNNEDKHFLHNLIAQHDQAMNVFKIYYPSKLEQQLYQGDQLEDPDKLHLHLVFNASDHLQGHSSIVHGGLLATLIDNTLGQLGTLASGLLPVATANLSIDYRKPVKTNEDYMITCEVDKIVGRKVYLKATIFDKNHNICTQAQGLFITVNWGAKSKWKQIIEKQQQKQEINKSI